MEPGETSLITEIIPAFTTYHLFINLLIYVFIAMLSIAETAFLSISSLQILGLKENDEKNTSKVLAVLDKPFTLRSTFIIWFIIALICFTLLNSTNWTSVLNTKQFSEATWILLASMVVQWLLLPAFIFVPKALTVKHNHTLIFKVYPLVVLLEKLVKPFILLYLFVLKSINSILPASIKISAQDFNTLDDGPLNNDETEEERIILRGVSNFSNISVKQIMRPRMDVVAIDMESSSDDILGIIHENGYSRIPVYEDSFDNIKGIINSKEFLMELHQHENIDWKTLIRPAFFIPESKKIDDLLKDFKSKRSHIAIVVDEYGGSSGIATLEDVLEELVGEINDEFDDLADDLQYSKLDPYTFVFEGKTLINDIYRIMDLSDHPFEEVRGEADTIAGLTLSIAGKFLKVNEVVEFENFKFTIESADNKRIKRVKIQHEETK